MFEADDIVIILQAFYPNLNVWDLNNKQKLIYFSKIPGDFLRKFIDPKKLKDLENKNENKDRIDPVTQEDFIKLLEYKGWVVPGLE